MIENKNSNSKVYTYWLSLHPYCSTSFPAFPCNYDGILSQPLSGLRTEFRRRVCLPEWFIFLVKLFFFARFFWFREVVIRGAFLNSKLLEGLF